MLVQEVSLKHIEAGNQVVVSIKLDRFCIHALTNHAAGVKTVAANTRLT
jgi:hypothetical protein